jgi:hypothetical protein
MLSELFDGLTAGPGFGDDLDVRLGLDQRSDPFSDKGVIVRQKNPDRPRT